MEIGRTFRRILFDLSPPVADLAGDEIARCFRQLGIDDATLLLMRLNAALIGRAGEAFESDPSERHSRRESSLRSAQAFLEKSLE